MEKDVTASARQKERFEHLLHYLKRSRGFDFSPYKRASLMRRIYKRIKAVKLDDFGTYTDYLEVHPEEFALLFNHILINVTAFFRDPPAWEYLKTHILPRIVEGKRADEPIRVWSAGCASGQEPYSLAITFCEELGIKTFQQRVKIYASDVDEEALAQARQASYAEKNLENIPPELQKKYFEKVGGQNVFRNDLRRTLVFGRHDLLTDAPISRLDLLICRNTLMYFNAEAQNRILVRFHFALNDDGYLFLGKAEMILTHANLFSPVDLKQRIFSKARMTSRDRFMVLNTVGETVGDEEGDNRVSRQLRTKELAMEAGSAAQVIVDGDGNLTFANERARRLFGLTEKDIGRLFRDLELSYRPIELRSIIEQVQSERRTVQLTNVEGHFLDRPTEYFDVEVVPLQENDALLGISIAFQDVTRTFELQEELQRSKQELETAYEELQSTNEELETTNEELQSTVEELETTNEELQSTNEELETMNEELHSTNEELQTVNTELRERTEEANQFTMLQDSILASLQFGVVVMDAQLDVLVWNNRSEDLWGLRADEVKGHSFVSLDIGLPVDELVPVIRACLNGELGQEVVTVQARNRRGKSIACRVALSPLRPRGQSPQGVILSMEEWDREYSSGRRP